ncbi:MAG TPA: hypothetical protein VFH48_38875 [Chloroflexota bacterium]|nr:hypothetical protein [Chloroflexota bacterium]
MAEYTLDNAWQQARRRLALLEAWLGSGQSGGHHSQHQRISRLSWSLSFGGAASGSG